MSLQQTFWRGIPPSCPSSQPQIVGNVKTAGYERLIRRMLNLTNKPAIIMMQTMAPGLAADPSDKNGAWKPFHITQEDVLGALSQYYDVQWMSFRDATYR